MVIPADTDQESFQIQLQLWRAMSAEQKFAQVFQLCDDARALVVDGIRSRHPEYSEDQIKHASFRIFLGDELYQTVWPDRPLLPS